MDGEDYEQAAKYVETFLQLDGPLANPSTQCVVRLPTHTPDRMVTHRLEISRRSQSFDFVGGRGAGAGCYDCGTCSDVFGGAGADRQCGGRAGRDPSPHAARGEAETRGSMGEIHHAIGDITVRREESTVRYGE